MDIETMTDDEIMDEFYKVRVAIAKSLSADINEQCLDMLGISDESRSKMTSHDKDLVVESFLGMGEI